MYVNCLQVHYVYKLPDGEGNHQDVCQVFFTSTLGFGPDSHVIAHCKKTTDMSSLVASPDMRGEL